MTYNEESKNIGLDINYKKSVIITNGRKEEIKITPEYIYLYIILNIKFHLLSFSIM